MGIWVGAYRGGGGGGLLIFSDIIFKMAAWRLDFSVSGLCRRHGFRSISQVCFGISIQNFICMLMVVIGRSLLIFNVTFKMAVWWPYWIFWFPDFNFSLAVNINSKLQWHNTENIYGQEPIDFQRRYFQNFGCFGFQTVTLVWLWIWTRNFNDPILVYMPIDFQWSHFPNGCLVANIRFFGFWTL